MVTVINSVIDGFIWACSIWLADVTVWLPVSDYDQLSAYNNMKL